MASEQKISLASDSLLMAIMLKAIALEDATEIYETRIKNKPMAVCPTKNDFLEQEARGVSRNVFLRYETLIKGISLRRNLDNREVRRIARQAKKHARAVLKRRKFRRLRRQRARESQTIDNSAHADLTLANAGVNENKHESTKTVRMHDHEVPNLRKILLELAEQDIAIANQDGDKDPQSVTIRRPKPMSTKEIRRRMLYDPDARSAAKFIYYIPLYNLWQSYIAELLGLTSTSSPPQAYTQFQAISSKLVSADFHGSFVRVTRCKCPTRVGITGIVIRESKSSFLICTPSDSLKTIPKGGTVFTINICPPPLVAEDSNLDSADTDFQKVKFDDAKNFLFSINIYGSQMLYRAADRSGRKFKSKPTLDL
ncbi:hypothetical protein V1511DRAFT_499005 [Dipodascopsis uninucleata]